MVVVQSVWLANPFPYQRTGCASYTSIAFTDATNKGRICIMIFIEHYLLKEGVKVINTGHKDNDVNIAMGYILQCGYEIVSFDWNAGSCTLFVRLKDEGKWTLG